MVEVPSPVISAPIELRKVTRSAISGSRAAFSITVLPSAKTAAMSKFSVAPTLGKFSSTLPPTSFSASPSIYPWLLVKEAPSSSRPFRCISIGLCPKSSPPGTDTFALPNLASSGPKTTIEALILSTIS